MDPRLIAFIGVAGLVAGALLPLAAANGAETSRVQSEAFQPLGALQVKSIGKASDRGPPIRMRCDQSALWFGEPCRSTAKI